MYGSTGRENKVVRSFGKNRKNLHAVFFDCVRLIQGKEEKRTKRKDYIFETPDDSNDCEKPIDHLLSTDPSTWGSRSAPEDRGRSRPGDGGCGGCKATGENGAAA